MRFTIMVNHTVTLMATSYLSIVGMICMHLLSIMGMWNMTLVMGPCWLL